MSRIVAPGSWPAAAAPGTFAPPQLGRALQEPAGRRDGLQCSGEQGMQWVLKRNCSLAPRHVLGVYAALCVLSIVIGLGFLWAGLPAVLPFASVELLAVGAALWVYARHAADREEITLSRGELRVEHHCGRRIDPAQFHAEWLRIVPAHCGVSLVELTGQGQRIRVGRYLRPEFRPALAHELRMALRRERARTAHQELQSEQ
jgi:uncharacterized membrane protein